MSGAWPHYLTARMVHLSPLSVFDPTNPKKPGYRPLALTAMLIGACTSYGQADTLLNAPPTDTSATKNAPQLPVFTLTTDALDGELGNQDISGILQSSRDVFTSVAGFSFGQARFRIRGYDSENTLVTINGVLVNDLETGWATWSNWAGLNDVTRWMQVRTEIGRAHV